MISIQCKICSDIGYVWQEKDGYTFIFRCQCPLGLTKEDTVPIYKEQFEPTNKAIIYE